MSKTIVLIVDDEEEICEIISFRLQEEGFIPLVAKNGEEALKIVNEQKVDVIISDVRMPIMDGITLLQRLKKDLESPPPIILLSGFSDISPDDAKKSGAFIFLNKPMEMKDLIRNIRNAVSS